jgi:hypothetical protein
MFRRGSVVAVLSLAAAEAGAAPPKEAPESAADKKEAAPVDEKGVGETEPSEPSEKGFSGDPVLDIVDRAPEKAAEQSEKEKPVDITPSLDPENVYGKSCKVNDDCVAPGSCVDKRCKAPAHEIRELARKGKAQVVAGGTVLGFGLALGVAGTIIVAVASVADSRDTQEVAPGSYESGYTLLGLGLGGLLSGAIVLGIGRAKLRKVEAYDRVANVRVQPIVVMHGRGGFGGISLRF